MGRASRQDYVAERELAGIGRAPNSLPIKEPFKFDGQESLGAKSQTAESPTSQSPVGDVTCRAGEI